MEENQARDICSGETMTVPRQLLFIRAFTTNRSTQRVSQLLLVWNYVPESKDGFLSEAGEAGGDSEHEGKDPEGGVDGNEAGTEAGGAFVADQQQKEAKETGCVLKW